MSIIRGCFLITFNFDNLKLFVSFNIIIGRELIESRYGVPRCVALRSSQLQCIGG